MSARDFVHLHVHSHYSLLEALPQISDLVKRAKAEGMKALALTDNGNMYAAIEFYSACKKAEIKPILGVDFFIAPRSRHDREYKIDDQFGRLVLLAQNETGYANLIRLVSESFLDGFFVRPRIDRELIEKYADGLIAILPSHAGESAYALRHQMNDRASQAFAWYQRIFPGRCYQEITKHPEIPGHEKEMQTLAACARECSVPIVAAQDVYYLDLEDGLACDLVNKIRTGGVLDRENGEYRMRDFSFLPSASMETLFADMPEALDNAVRIADECNVHLDLGKWVFPDFPIPPGTTHDSELRELAFSGFERRNMEQTPEVLERVEY